MALLSILTGHVPQRTRFQNREGVDLMLVDCTLSFLPEYEAEVTENPVEDGDGDVSDNVLLKNVRLKIEGFASDHPITLGSSIRGLVTSAASIAGSRVAGALGGAIGAVAGGIGANLATQLANFPSEGSNPSALMEAFLLGLFRERKTFTLWTPRRKYDDLVMKTLTFPRDPGTGQGLYFIATMAQIRIVRAELVRLDNIASAVSHTAAKTGKLGSQSGKPTDAAKERGSSALYTGLEGLGIVR